MAQKWASGGSTKAHTSTAYAKGGGVQPPVRPADGKMRSESTQYAKSKADFEAADKTTNPAFANALISAHGSKAEFDKAHDAQVEANDDMLSKQKRMLKTEDKTGEY
jgi:hypothetical protein